MPPLLLHESVNDFFKRGEDNHEIENKQSAETWRCSLPAKHQEETGYAPPKQSETDRRRLNPKSKFSLRRVERVRDVEERPDNVRDRNRHSGH